MEARHRLFIESKFIWTDRLSIFRQNCKLNRLYVSSDRLTSLVVIATGGLLLPHMELQPAQYLTYY